MEQDEPFEPETIDEHIERALDRSPDESSPESHIVQRLSVLYEADLQATARVQQRLARHLAEHKTSAHLVPGSFTFPSDRSQEKPQDLQPGASSPGKTGSSRFLLVATTLLVVIVLVGSMLTVFHLMPIGQASGKPISPASSFRPGSYDSINSRLFSNTSPWNVPIGTNVQFDPNSGVMVSQLTACCHVPSLFSYGMPIYTSTASDPLYTVQDSGNDHLFEAEQPIHIPNTAAPAPGGNHWMFIYDQTKQLLFEMWMAQKNGDTWTTQTGDVYSPTGDGVLQIDGSQQSGNGASYFGGVVTDADIQRGFINHALALAASDIAAIAYYPMHARRRQSTYTGIIPLGARLQLDPSVNCQTLPGATKGEKMICQALETYGGYVRDTGGVTLSIYFEGEDLTDPNRHPPDGSPGNPARIGGIDNQIGLQDGQDLPDIPWDKLRVLKSWNSFTPLKTPPSPAPVALVGGTHTSAVSDATSLAWPGLPAKREDEE